MFEMIHILTLALILFLWFYLGDQAKMAEDIQTIYSEHTNRRIAELQERVVKLEKESVRHDVF
jgi:hypothetical protein